MQAELLCAGTSVNCQDNKGRSALHLVAVSVPLLLLQCCFRAVSLCNSLPCHNTDQCGVRGGCCV